MALHKFINGGEAYLPVALRELKRLVSLGQFAVGRTITTPDVTINVKVVGAEQFIHIMSISGPSYEFYTSELFLASGLPAIPLFGSGTRVNLANGHGKPVFSYVHVPPAHPELPDDPDKWWFIDYQYPQATAANLSIPPYSTGLAWITDHILFTSPDKYFATSGSWQLGYQAESHSWPKNDKGMLTVATRSLAGGQMNQVGYEGIGRNKYGSSGSCDVGLDVPPAYYDKFGVQYGAPAGLGNAWWRNAAVQHVPGYEGVGERKFFVMADTHGRFFVYPVLPYQTIYGVDNDKWARLQIPANVYGTKVLTPAYPSWATIPSLAATLDRKEEFIWSFNKNADRAVTILGHRSKKQVTAWQTAGEQWTDGPPESPVTHWTWAHNVQPVFVKHGGSFGYSWAQWHFVDPATSPPAVDGLIPAYEESSGLFEVAINITVTGPNDADFTASVSTVLSEYSGDPDVPGDDRWYVNAGHAILPQLITDNKMNCTEDALLTAEIELYGADIPMVMPDVPYSGGTPDTVWHSHNMQSLSAPGLTGLHSRYVRGTYSAFLVIREHATQTVLRKIFLGNNHIEGALEIKDTNGTDIFIGTVLNNVYADNVTPKDEALGSVSSYMPCNRVELSDIRTMSFVVRGELFYVSDGGNNYVSPPVPHVSHQGFKTDIYTWNEFRESDDGLLQTTSQYWISGVHYTTTTTGPYAPHPTHPYSSFPSPHAVETDWLVVDDRNHGTTPVVMDKKFPRTAEESAYARIVFQNANTFYSGMKTATVNAHPQGHWAFGAAIWSDPEGKLDIIQAYDSLGIPKKRMSHRSAYNAAFDQNRGVTYYGSGVPFDPNGGSFCEAGIWKTF